ncbi:MAG TPA: type II secretion system F family protein [Sphingobium sp.]|nr:type II secretion system F family protein [Sphingobium sp.]
MIDVLASSLVLRLAALLAIFLAVTAMVAIAARAVASRAVVRHRLAESAPIDVIGVSSQLRDQKKNNAWIQLTEAIERAGIPLIDEKNDALRARLAMAGFPSPSAARIFTLLRLTLLVILPGIYLIFALSGGEQPSLLRMYIISLLLAVVGMYAPNALLTARADRRKQEIVNGFPDCLDLMLICVEAGLGMEAAFDRVGREIMQSHPRLAEIFSAATLELRAGGSREQALRSMARRAQVEEIKSFTTLLIQSDRLGTSIGKTLRVYADEMREKRRLRAEEKAHRLPVLLSVPLVACLLPTMIGVLMLPAAIRVVKVLLPLMQGTN